MICIAMEEPLKDGETENIRENLKGFIHLGQLPRLFGMLMQTIKGRYYAYKKVSNRKVRYYKGDLLNGNAYKKLFDLWWQIY